MGIERKKERKNEREREKERKRERGITTVKCLCSLLSLSMCKPCVGNVLSLTRKAIPSRGKN